MNEIKSIWDGWQKQCFGELWNSYGETCARGFIVQHEGEHSDLTRETYQRVANYISREFEIVACDECCRSMSTWLKAMCIIVRANNELKLTPEEFRAIDRETQIEAALKSIETQHIGSERETANVR